jgi:LysR family transcriptional regulator for metE and metH
MDLEIRHLMLVRAVAAAGSLTRAGLALHLTQSALSHQLQDIEQRLGTALFLRVGKRMVLTPAGERVLASADSVLTAMERTEEAVRHLAGARSGVLRLTTQCYTCYHWLPPLLKRFQATHPRVDVRIDATATNDPITHLLDGRLDVAIISDPVHDRRVVVQPLFDDEMVAIVEPRHALAGKTYVQLEDFAGQTLLIYPPKEESTIYQRLLVPAGVVPGAIQGIQLTEAIIELVKAGLGIAVLAAWAVAPHVKAGTLRALPVTRRGYRRTWSAATMKDTAQVPHIREFIDLIAVHPPFSARASGTRIRALPRRSRSA